MAFDPAGPGPTAPASGTVGRQEIDILSFLDKMDEESKVAHDDIIADNYEEFLGQYSGERQWGSKEDTGKYRTNIIKAILRRKVALVTESKPGIRVLERRAGLLNTAAIMQKLITAQWDEHSIDMQLEKGELQRRVLGATFFKVAWDKHAENGRGNLLFKCIDPRCVSIDPAIEDSADLDHAQYVITKSVMALHKVMLDFPGRGQLVRPDERISAFDNEEPSLGGRIMGPVRAAIRQAYRGRKRLDDGSVPRAFIRDYQFCDYSLENGERKYPFGRHIIRGGDDVILYDEPNPYFDGGWDLVMIDGVMDLDHPWGQSEVEDLRPIQESMNRIGSQFVDNVIIGGGVRIVMDQGSMSPDDETKLSNLPGLIIRKLQGRQVDFQAPAEMPAHYLAFPQQALQMANFLAGLDDGTLQTKGRVEQRSGAQLEGLQSAAQVLVRSDARRLEAGLERIGAKLISRNFQYMTDDRILISLGENNEFHSFQFERQKLTQELLDLASKEVAEKYKDIPPPEGAIEEAMTNWLRNAWKELKFKITPSSTLAATKLQRAQMLGGLVDKGYVPITDLLREVGYENAEEVIKKAREQMQQWPPPPPPQKAKGKK